MVKPKKPVKPIEGALPNLFAIVSEAFRTDAIALINSLPKDPQTLLYVDPPYLNAARKSKDNRTANQAKSLTRRQYAHELSEDRHRELAIALQGRSVILSGYQSDLYRDLYPEWQVRTKRWAGDTEYLWVSPEAIGLVPQLQLFYT